jgi:hypothetical protein
VQFSPVLGAAFVAITFHGCIEGFIGLNKTFNVTGTAVASANNATGELEFKSGAPNNKLLFAGEEATYVGKDKTLMVGGGE